MRTTSDSPTALMMQLRLFPSRPLVSSDGPTPFTAIPPPPAPAPAPSGCSRVRPQPPRQARMTTPATPAPSPSTPPTARAAWGSPPLSHRRVTPRATSWRMPVTTTTMRTAAEIGSGSCGTPHAWPGWTARGGAGPRTLERGVRSSPPPRISPWHLRGLAEGDRSPPPPPLILMSLSAAAVAGAYRE